VIFNDFYEYLDEKFMCPIPSYYIAIDIEYKFPTTICKMCIKVIKTYKDKLYSTPTRNASTREKLIYYKCVIKEYALQIKRTQKTNII